MILSNRKQAILKAIVEDYIATAEPVSSKSLIKKYPLQLSSATVRNVMAELEDEGYLQQPHVSAGRIPADKAYRLYVDSLIDIPEVQPDVKEKVETALQDDFHAWETALKKAAEVMTNSTGYTSVALATRTERTSILQIKLLMVEPGCVLVVLVLAPGIVRDRLINIPPQVSNSELQRLGMAIEQGLAGRKLNEITWITVENTGRGSELPESLLNQVLFEAYMAIKQSDNLDAYLDGIQNLLRHPEFRDPDKAKDILNVLTRDGMLAGYLTDSYLKEDASMTTELGDGTKRPKFMIRIGQEITLPGLSDCSFVTTTYALADNLIGQIGVVGPRRMDYRRVMANMNFIRQVFKKKISGRNER